MNITSAVWKLLLVFLLPLSVVAQVLPAEGSKLNYRIVGFSFPNKVETTKCELQIAEGYYNNIDSFSQKIILRKQIDKNKVIAEVPFFGKEYTWRLAYTDSKPGAGKTTLRHFSTLEIPNIDTGHMRLRILQNAKTYNDAYVFLDGNRALYDMKGNPVWFLPDNAEGFQNTRKELRDMKISPQGTITFLIGKQIYEVNYDGSVLWMGPDNGIISGGLSEDYHHEFTRLSNGNYMVLGNEYAYLDLSAIKENKGSSSKSGGGEFKK